MDAGLELAEDPETRLWLLAMRGAAGIRWGAVRLTEPAFVAERAAAVTAAIDGARRLGLHDLVVVAGRISGQLEFAAGRYPESAAAYRGLVPNLDAVDSVFQRALTAMYVVLGLADVAGAYDEALAVARDVLTLGRTLTAHEHAHGTSSILWCQYHLGDWAEMEPLVEEHLRAVQDADLFICPYMRGGALIGALIAAHLGDHARARQLMATAPLTDEEPGLPEALHARVLVALGDAEAGVAEARRMIDSGRRPSIEDNAQEVLALIDGLHALGAWEELRAFLPTARGFLGMLAILEPFCDRAEGLVRAADGDVEGAIAILREALAGFQRLGVRYEASRTMAILAHHLPAGDAMLAEAMAAAESLLVGRQAGPEGTPAAAPDPRPAATLATAAATLPTPPPRSTPA